VFLSLEDRDGLGAGERDSPGHVEAGRVEVVPLGSSEAQARRMIGRPTALERALPIGDPRQGEKPDARPRRLSRDRCVGRLRPSAFFFIGAIRSSTIPCLDSIRGEFLCYFFFRSREPWTASNVIRIWKSPGLDLLPALPILPADRAIGAGLERSISVSLFFC
jgi:hypothetical protein